MNTTPFPSSVWTRLPLPVTDDGVTIVDEAKATSSAMASVGSIDGGHRHSSPGPGHDSTSLRSARRLVVRRVQETGTLHVMDEAGACQTFFDSLAEIYLIRSIKLYRLRLDPVPPVPVLPCLDHEAMLHEAIPRHAAAYVEDPESHDLHEIVIVPASALIEIDIASTAEEHSVDSRTRVVRELRKRFPAYRVKTNRPSYLRGDRRVMNACRAQVSLRDVLNSEDFALLDRSLDRLRTVGELMEKQSRVASWGVRTLTGPLLATTGFVIYGLLGMLTPQLGELWARGLQYSSVGVLGVTFVYYGLKAVHLTEMANRVWKRAAEYSLIVTERRRLKSRAE